MLSKKSKTEPRLDERIRALTELLLEEAEKCGLDHLMVTSELASGGMQTWSRIRGPNAGHGFRTILPNEIVFDVGDRGDWERCRRTTHALWRVLNKWDVPYWGALSGGKGTHTHVFLGHDGPGCTLRPRVEKVRREDGKVDLVSEWPYDVGRNDIRETVAEIAVRQAHQREAFNDRLLVEDHWEHLDVDRGKVAAGPNKGMVRAFGSRNRERKSLWTVGPGPFPLLQPSRAQTYNNHDVVIPDELSAAGAGTPGVEHSTIAQALSKECPKGPACMPGSIPGRDVVCRRCPARM